MVLSDTIFFGFFPIAVAIYYLIQSTWWQHTFLILLSAAFLSLFGSESVMLAGGVALLVWGGGWLQARLNIKGQWPVATILIAILILIKVTSGLAQDRIGASYYIFILLSIVWFLPDRVGLNISLRTVFFLPHILAGPISRARAFVSQLEGRKGLKYRNIFVGAHLMLLGLIKKVLIADPIALSMEPVWSEPSAFSGSAMLIVAFSFYIQLYADFSGYTDLARGVARILGYRLPINFRGPYLAATPIEFWRRWHISLSTWIRLYLYTPLAMQVWRRVRAKWAIEPSTIAIVVVVMIVVGLWHEISLRFLTFGAIQGILVGLWYVAGRGRTELRGLAWFLSWITFQALLVLSLVIFRAESLSSAVIVFERIWAWSDGMGLNEVLPGLAIVTVVVFIFQWIEYNTTRRAVARCLRVRSAAQVFPFVVATLGVVMFCKGLSIEGVWVAPTDPYFHAGSVPFIYARF